VSRDGPGLLVDPVSYAPGTLDLDGDPDLRRYWLALFRRHAAAWEDGARREGAGSSHRRAVGRASAAFRAELARLERDGRAQLDVLALCALRERALRDAGVADLYAQAKADANREALALLPGLLAELDALPTGRLLRTLVAGVFAGNLFDLGADATADLHARGGVDFHRARERLLDTPWRVDDLAAVEARWQRRPPWRSVLVFVDNAGGDVVLGVIPLARALLERGTRVVLSANSSPALNDVTHDELSLLLERAATLDARIADALAAGSLRAVPSGNGLPLLHLGRLGSELRAEIAARPPDLVVLEGMGRAIESNWRARLRCECWRLALVKDASVAKLLGAELYDGVCRFDAAGATRTPA